MSHHLPECFLSNPCRNKEGHSIITVVGGVPLGRDLCEACMADCICYRLRKAEQRVRDAFWTETRVPEVDSYRKGREDAARDVDLLLAEWEASGNWGADADVIAAARGVKA